MLLQRAGPARFRLFVKGFCHQSSRERPLNMGEGCLNRTSGELLKTGHPHTRTLSQRSEDRNYTQGQEPSPGVSINILWKKPPWAFNLRCGNTFSMWTIMEGCFRFWIHEPHKITMQASLFLCLTVRILTMPNSPFSVNLWKTQPNLWKTQKWPNGPKNLR